MTIDFAKIMTGKYFQGKNSSAKVGCIFPMVISPECHMEQYVETMTNRKHPTLHWLDSNFILSMGDPSLTLILNKFFNSYIRE